MLLARVLAACLAFALLQIVPQGRPLSPWGYAVLLFGGIYPLGLSRSVARHGRRTTYVITTVVDVSLISLALYRLPHLLELWSLLYLLPIVGASIGLQRRGGLYTASLAAISQALVAYGGRLEMEPGTYAFLALATATFFFVGLTMDALMGGRVLEPAALVAQKEEWIEELFILAEASRLAASTLDPHELAQRLVELLEERFRYEVVAVLLIDEATGRLVPWGLSNYSPEDAAHIESFEPGLDKGITGWVARTGQPALVNDVREDERYLAVREDTRSELCVPIRIGERVIGVINIETSRPAAYNEHDLRLLSIIADQVAVAVEKAQLYQETLEEKQKAETILEKALAGLMVVNPYLEIMAVNPGAEAIIGYSSAEIVGRPLLDILDPAIWRSEKFSQRATGEPIAPLEATIQGKDGPRDVLLGISTLPDGYLLSFADITHLKEVDRLKSTIVANVSHELRAPLASIKVYTELLRDHLDRDDGHLSRQFLTIIDQETDRLADLVNGVLDLSRIEAGQFEVRKRPLHLREVIDRVVTLLDVQARERGISIQVDVPSHLPSLLADEDLMTTLVKNLVSNAVKFNRQGGQVDIVAREEGDEIVFSVADQGIGIPPEAMPHLFEKFYRVHSTTESGIQGTGLGLALAKEAAEAHGGVIEVESQVGVGSRFTVRLPKG
ncbi:MAG: ATP-binding protein [Anaerolineae bacterium]